MMAALAPKNESTPQQGCNNGGGKFRTAQCDLVFQPVSRLIFFWVDAKRAFRWWKLGCVEQLELGQEGVR